MAKNNLLQEAIADAKAVRETALANAKIALEEAFTPRIQSMLSAKLAEEEEIEEDKHNPAAPDSTNSKGNDLMAGADMNEEEDMEEGMHDDEKNEGMHGDDEVSETEDMEEGEHGDMEEGEHGDMEEDLELEAIIKELEDELDEELDSSEIGSADNKEPEYDEAHTEDPGEGELTEEKDDMDEEKEDMDETKDDMDEDISLDEIINALKEEEGDDKVDEGDYDKKKTDEGEKDLEEAYAVIKFLKSKINEVNLLNAKLLFSNKLFRNHSLNENQKMKVIENFDRATNLREVKLIFATLSESFNLGGKAKRTIKESYASKATKSTKPSKAVITEGNDLAARWKKLANL
jgi:hypothetical protein